VAVKGYGCQRLAVADKDVFAVRICKSISLAFGASFIANE